MNREHLEGVRIRGQQVSRLESFSDCVFGFALTLLVVSLEVPRDFDGLVRTMFGFFGFAICFAMLYQVWTGHYTYFRKYGLADASVRVANGFLLFVIVGFVYPLKFLFSSVFSPWLVKMVVHSNLIADPTPMSNEQIRSLFIIYGTGFVCVELIFAFLYFHASRRAVALEFTPAELFWTRMSMIDRLATAVVPFTSIVLAIMLPPGLVGLCGFAYFLIGIAKSAVGIVAGRRRRKLGFVDPQSLS